MAVDQHNTDQSLLFSSSSSGFFCQEHETFFSLNKPIETSSNNNNTWSCFGSSDSGSQLSSPVESELGSTETEESDPEEDYCAELSRQMAHYMFQDDDKQEKSWGSAVSPQSTLWPPFGSNHESPQGPSREPSPPVPTVTVIEQLEKMKINNPLYNNTEVSSSISNNNYSEIQSKQALIDDQIRAIQFYRLKQEHGMKHVNHKKQLKQNQNKSRAFGGSNNGQKTNRPPSSTSNSWPSLHQTQTQTQTNQQQPGSGTRAVFLGGSAGSRPASGGTGVFLPTRISNSSPDQSRKKSGSATVIIPARVIQALKQHFDRVGVPSTLSAATSNFPSQHDIVLGGRNNGMYTQQQQQQSQSMNKQEMGLPQEWTY